MAHPLPKVATGIGGFDELSQGGEKEDEERGKTLQRRAQFEHKRRELQVTEAEREKELRGIRSADPAKRNGSNGSRG